MIIPVTERTRERSPDAGENTTLLRHSRRLEPCEAKWKARLALLRMSFYAYLSSTKNDQNKSRGIHVFIMVSEIKFYIIF